MKKVVDIHAAKTHFSKLVEEVEAGAEVTIARAGITWLRPKVQADFYSCLY